MVTPAEPIEQKIHIGSRHEDVAGIDAQHVAGL